MSPQSISKPNRAALASMFRVTDIPEINEMAAALGKQHGPEVMEMACLLLLTQSLMQRCGKQNGSNLGPLITLQAECVRALAVERGIDFSDVVDALAGLDRAGRTAEYLSHVPD